MNIDNNILIKQGFVFSPAPFSDIIAIISKNDNFKIPDFLNCSQFQTKIITKRFSIFYSGPDFKNNIFSGYAFDDEKLIYGQEKESALKKFMYHTGNFTYWELDGNELGICHDFFGMGSIFYFENDSYIIISNRLHLAAIIINQLNISYELNTNFIHSLILFSYPFKDQPFNNDTPILNLNYLDLNYYIKVSETGLKILARPQISIHENSSYDSLLHNGIEELKRNVRNVYEFSQSRKLSLDLSGGKDSRIVLGVCLENRNSELIKNLQIYSHKIGTPEDLEIAITIATLFNLEFLDEFSAPLTYLPCATALQIFRSFFMGSYFRMPLNLSGAPSALGRTSNALRLSGSCGELYRDYQNTYYSDQYGSTFMEVMEHIFETSGWKSSLQENDRKALKTYILTSIFSFNKYPLPLARQKFYEWSRLRKHFGLRIYNFFNASQIFFPILSTSLYKACSFLDFDQMKNARLIYDTLNSLSDILPEIKFYHPWEFAERLSRYDLIPKKDLLDKFHIRFKEASSRYSKSRQDHISNARISTAEQEKELINQSVEKALSAISAKFKSLSAFTGTLKNIYISYSRDSEEKARNMAARIFSLHDLIFPLNDINLQMDI